MAPEPVVIDAEKKLTELSASLGDFRSKLLADVEQLRGQDRENMQASIKDVTDQLASFRSSLKEMERGKIGGLEIVDPTKKVYTEADFHEKFSFHRMSKLLVKTANAQAPISTRDCGMEQRVMNEYALKVHGATFPEVVQHASQNVGQDAAGGLFVPQEISTAMIPQLVAAMVSARAGVQLVTGLVGNMSWPKKVSGVAGQWLDTEAEQSITTETLVFGSVSAKPHPFAAAVPITWLALQQPSISMEATVRADFVEKLGLLWDKAIFLGTGVQGQPRGITAWPGIGGVSWSGVTFGTASDTSLAKLREHFHDLREANALGDGSSLAWVAAPDAMFKLEKTLDADGRPLYLTKDQAQIERLIGYPVYNSTALDQGDSDEFLLFGKFNEALHCTWGGLQFAVSDAHASNFLTGVVVVRAIGSCDVVVRQPLAFSWADAMSV